MKCPNCSTRLEVTCSDDKIDVKEFKETKR